MAVKAVELETRLIEGVCELVRDRLPEQKATPCVKFVRQYYHWVPAEDLADRDVLDLYGAAMAHWKLARRREPGEAKVRVYNPNLEQDGWQSPHTVLEIVSDDMPFLVDSVNMELSRLGYAIDLVIHPVMRMLRDREGALVDVLDPRQAAPDAIAESILHAEVAREADQTLLAELGDSIERVLCEVRVAVEDWQPMRQRTQALIDELSAAPAEVSAEEIAETREFLAWVAHDNFTFLGYREYQLVTDGGAAGLQAVADSGLGILRGSPRTPYTPLSSRASALARSSRLLVLTKANSRATVHRPSYLDYIGVKQFSERGEVIGERRFLGLYTTVAYRASPRDIPLLRGKVKRVMDRAAFPSDSHDAKGLIEILETFPRDLLFQIETDDLLEMAIGILGLGERQRVRLFMWPDPLERFVSCLVTIPRDRFNTENRERVGRILLEALGGSHLDWSLQLSESLLVRVHYIIHCPDGTPPEIDVLALEAKLARATRAWIDDLRAALLDDYGEERGGKLFRRYGQSFSPAYRSAWPAAYAAADIAHLEQLRADGNPIISLYRPLEAAEDVIRCKLFSVGGVSLSGVLPSFEHMGAHVVDERPYEIHADGSDSVWIYDFGLRSDVGELERVRDSFQEAFLSAWCGDIVDDGLNGLVLRAGLTGRQVTVLRGVARYWRQVGSAFSDRYVERTLIAHPDVAAKLVALFYARFDPDGQDVELAGRLAGEITAAIDAVESLDEDRILRSFLSVVCAMLRTNYFTRKPDGSPPRYLSFKLDPGQLSMLPLPRPRFEVFVHSPRMEGVHLRGGKVARGGIRWSDRQEDFRTEILGLMKAQMVKNALIVPIGSKGGFVVKRPPSRGGREALVAEAVECYRTFLAGLLDITDNIVAGEVVAPERVVRYDEDDPYLVVAADKGTASFSDIANAVSADYGYWLGDAFASGGSQGYDHKEMGITARGAWESVKRHFRELGADVQSTDFTVVGVGDMSGDVFGNGMLLSPHIKLLGAFNHLHIFIDPDPDPRVSFAERKRLYELPRSAWSDYDREAISEGGGVYSRAAKSIRISAQAQQALGVQSDQLSPTDLIRALLRAPVDLLWNGGIGTYVKASDETQADVGDKGNDAVRVDAAELRCRVVGEGGNLGVTQRGRIEYALAGGRINTDAIDNVAGVNTSDHEVNIKILLDALVSDGDLTFKQRNELLHAMTDAVAEQVLYASYTQTQAMSLALAQAAPMIDVHARLIRHLEQVANLDRDLEYLPSEETIRERKAAHHGLVAPELAVLMAYCKISLKQQLLESDLPEDPFLGRDLERYFPPPIGTGRARPSPSSDGAQSPSDSPGRYAEPMRGHRLRREIIATVVANQLVDRAGTTFAFRLAEETGAASRVLARGYAAAREALAMRSFWASVEALDNQVEAEVQLGMLIEGRRLLERATRWIVRANPRAIDISYTVRYFKPGAKMLASALPELLDGSDRESFDRRAEEFMSAGVPAALAARVAGAPSMLSVFDITEVADVSRREPRAVMEVYFRLGSLLGLNWLRDRIIELPRADRWQSLARSALRDDLYALHRLLTHEVLEASSPERSPEEAIEAWMEDNQAAVQRNLQMLADIRAARAYDTTTLPVALREVRNLIRTSGDSVGVAGAESVTLAG